MKLILTLSVVFTMLVHTTTAQVAQINFSNTSYTYGIKPTNSTNSDIENVYTSWRNTFAEQCTNGRYRIKFDTRSETVSEGVAYGMLLSAYANDKELFDGLWLYYQDFSNANGVMNWKIKECSQVLGENGASDAELDAAIGLMVADTKWGNDGVIDYKADAKRLIATIKTHEIESGTGVLKPGDVWGGSNNTNPSYFATGYFRAFGAYTNDTVFWNGVADKSYAIINANLTKQNAAYNLVSDWCEADGDYSTIVPWAFDEGRSYNYDAARTPWRIAVDYLWYGNQDALDYLDLCNAFVDDKGGFDQIFPGYRQTGVAINTTFRDPTFTGAYATAAMSVSNQNYVNAAYAELKKQTTDAYFGSTLRAIYMFVMSGNGYNPLQIQGNTLGTVTKKATKFVVYPNPTAQSLTINFSKALAQPVTIQSILGQSVMQVISSGRVLVLDVSHLKSGVYFVNANGDTQKIVKL